MNYFDPISLQLFIAICEMRSLTKAADRSNLTVSAVSKRLASLEEQIGAPLLERGRKGIQLTAAGEALLPAARGLLQSMSKIQANLSEFAQSVPGHVRIASTMSAITSFLPQDIRAFLKRHPHVKVDIHERGAADIVRSVEEGRADIGVCWEVTGTKRLQVHPYRQDHLVVIAHQDHEIANQESISFAETLDYSRVTLQGSSLVQGIQQRLAIAEGKALKSSIQVRTYDAACRIADANLAIAIVPREAAWPMIESLQLKAIALTDKWAQRQFVICMKDYNDLAVHSKLLVDTLSTPYR
ncbi:LysR family transcriptional regulator [Comamonas sp. Y33R10-2]|uniref:LysR family transcriptional regulator n=1 Tax=Comamonas sp. Y33R10-2 TaxID=2853257 RepID=UPI001C5CA51A|nr:LysR family transcriptional regulator [Comamonas sp. Y33R10-2]QXZ10717.1 LysR family transcriptional regulator [Comamonas sp. Y33R10-2]